MTYTPRDLADALEGEPESMYVRLTAPWLTHGGPAGPRPALTHNRVADALVAGAVALQAQWQGVPTPAWVKTFLPGPDPNALTAMDAPGLVVSAASPEYLLALKVHASRIDRDEDDIRLLAQPVCAPGPRRRGRAGDRETCDRARPAKGKGSVPRAVDVPDRDEAVAAHTSGTVCENSSPP